MVYKVKLDLFEGPLDLLLYLIKKDELDIYDIPIARVTEQYLQYLDLMKLLDLNIAGEFLVMAATLMQIKSKMLLPQPEIDEEAEEEQDPREELVKRLIEYKKFKEAATELQHRGIKQKDLYARGAPSLTFDRDENESEYFEASLFDLISAFTKVMKEIPKDLFHEIVKEEFTVEEKMHDIFHLLVKTPKMNFSDLFNKAKNKIEIIATFMAILELIRLKEITVMQHAHFDEIVIERNKDSIRPSRGNE